VREFFSSTVLIKNEYVLIVAIIALFVIVTVLVPLTTLSDLVDRFLRLSALYGYMAHETVIDTSFQEIKLKT